MTAIRRREALLLGAAGWLAGAADASDGPSSAKVGRAAPLFKLADSEGHLHELASVAAKHRVTVLNFWATWCAPCIKELPQFDAVYKALKGEGVALLAINALESADKVSGFARKLRPSFPLLVDTEGEALGPYVGFSGGLPMTFLIDGRGVLRERISGPLEAAALKAKLRALLAGPRLNR